jgi:ATP-dependent DNA helicase RecG
MANSPGGGAIVLGVEDRTGSLLGTALDPEWLRHRIFELVEVAPNVEVRFVDGARLLVLYVAEAREPVEDLQGRIRWRTADHCVPVDRSQWWLHRQETAGFDPMAASTRFRLADCSRGALVQARRYLLASGAPGAGVLANSSDPDLLSRLGVLRPDGHLTQAGALAFCPCDQTMIEFAVIDVEGGDVLAHPLDLAGLSIIEQLAEVETRLDTLNTSITLRSGFVHTPIRRLPPGSVREALLNAVIHRDWMRREPIDVRWIQEDSALEVSSPGAFVGGVSAANALTQRYARNPALADLFRALHLVEKQGSGIDRMYQEMLSLGHRPPLLSEEIGPRVRVRMDGGDPILPVLALTSAIQPAVRRRDVRIALIVRALLNGPFVTPAGLQTVLQRTESECGLAIDAAAESRVNGHPLICEYKDVWTLSDEALALVENPPSPPLHRQVLPYRHPGDPELIVRPWLRWQAKITSGDLSRLSGVSRTGALNQLTRLERAGLLRRGPGEGRSASFQAAGSLRVSLTRERDQYREAHEQ